MAGGPIGGGGPNRVIEFVPNKGLIPDSTTFDPALIAAMDRPWRDIVISQPQVVASGMTPPESVPT
jgi:hypothetical protein